MLPDFLCIGAQKAGTTWLYHNLRQHPQVWMSPAKEIHYFDAAVEDAQRYPLLYELLDKQAARHDLTRRAVRQALRSRLLSWTLHYLLWRRTDRWYAGLFRPRPGQIGGEITPAYSRLESKTIGKIHNMMPSCQIIYLLRDPVSRFWSQLDMYIRATPDLDINTISDEELFQISQSNFANFYRNSDYLANLARWETYYDRQQIFVGFYDQIRHEPESLLLSIYAFLNIDCDESYLPKERNRAHNVGSSRPIPEFIERWLTEQMYPQLVGLHERFDNPYTAKWLEKANRTTARTTVRA